MAVSLVIYHYLGKTLYLRYQDTYIYILLNLDTLLLYLKPHKSSRLNSSAVHNDQPMGPLCGCCAEGQQLLGHLSSGAERSAR